MAAASSDAPSSPAPNSTVANEPASGRSAMAASPASLMCTPALWRVAAQATAMASPITPVSAEPMTTSIRSQRRLATVIFLSTAYDWMNASPQGASVVPKVAAIATQPAAVEGKWGTNELYQTSDQSGLAKMPSTM